jgi:hypothetical protein
VNFGSLKIADLIDDGQSYAKNKARSMTREDEKGAGDHGRGGPIRFARNAAPARRPLERRRDWVVTVFGLIAVGIGGGYLLEGRLIAWPLLVSLGVFIVALHQRYRR